jgi:hypothetical protein
MAIMNQVIAIPDNSMYRPLTERIDAVAAEYKFDVVRVSEHRCAELLLRNSAELALLTPLGYGQAVGRADYRIIRGPALVTRGLSYMASIYMRENAERLERCVSTHGDDFMMRVGAMILNEKFGLSVDIRSVKSAPVHELLREHDIVVDWGFEPEQKVVLDISDEWFDLTGLSLPMMMWACRPDDMPENIAEIVQAFASPEARQQTIVEQTYHGTNAEREGTISWQWDDGTEPALQRLFEMMFFLQYIPEIPAVKIWGRDPVE